MREVITVTLMEQGGPTLICPRTAHSCYPDAQIIVEEISVIISGLLLTSPSTILSNSGLELSRRDNISMDISYYYLLIPLL